MCALCVLFNAKDRLQSLLSNSQEVTGVFLPSPEFRLNLTQCLLCRKQTGAMLLLVLCSGRVDDSLMSLSPALSSLPQLSELCFSGII